jgi:hypothetical protein
MRYVAYACLGLWLVFTNGQVVFTLYLLEKINDKLPLDRQIIPNLFYTNVPHYKVLYRMYAEYYPDGKVVRNIMRCTWGSFVFFLLGIGLLLWSTKK